MNEPLFGEHLFVLECRAASKVYRTPAGSVEALRPVSFDLCRGQTVAVVGPSGSGKSTLLGLLAGLERPTAGDIVFNGTPYSRLGRAGLIAHRRRNVGFVFQTWNLVVGLNVEDNIALPLWLNAWPARKIGRRVDELLGRLDLAPLRKRLPRQLSGGEAQRVALARAVAHRPALLLADEPTGNLDRLNADRVADLIVALAAEDGCAAVVATHNRSLAERFAGVVDLAGEWAADG